MLKFDLVVKKYFIDYNIIILGFLYYVNSYMISWLVFWCFKWIVLRIVFFVLFGVYVFSYILLKDLVVCKYVKIISYFKLFCVRVILRVVVRYGLMLNEYSLKCIFGVLI